MTTVHVSRAASIDEIAAEMDRRGEVIARMEREASGMDYRIRRLEAALRVARGYVRTSDWPFAGADLKTIDQALARPAA